MKKSIKIISAIALVFAICLSFSSCFLTKKAGDEIAIYIDDSHKQIRFHNKTYTLVEDVPHYWQSYSLNECTDLIEQGTPMLFYEMNSEWLDYSDDGRMIRTGEKFYCSEECYDYAVSLVENKNIDSYCVSLYDEDYNSHETLIDGSVVDKINEIILNGTPTEDYPSIEDSVYIYHCDKEMLFMYDAYCIDKTIYGKYLVSDYSEEYESDIYVVDPTDSDFFDKYFPEKTNEGISIIK